MLDDAIKSNKVEIHKTRKSLIIKPYKDFLVISKGDEKQYFRLQDYTQNSETLSLDKNKNLVENETLSPSNTTKTETNNEANRVVENDGSVSVTYTKNGAIHHENLPA